YVTNMGYRLSLTPSFPAGTDASLLPRFVLTVKASSTQTQPYDFYYLAPAGMFTLSVVVTKQPIAGANPVQRVVCGTSGLEYLGLMQSGGNLMYFFPAQAAYAGGFGGGSSSAAGLSKVAQTSWAYLTGPGGASLNYYAQPLGAALYSGDTSKNFASFLELCGGTLPGAINLTAQVPTMFPMAPFSGIQDTDYTAYQQLELQVLNPVRRSLIYQLAPPPQVPITPPPPTAGTPQGLLASFDSTGVSFTIAQSS